MTRVHWEKTFLHSIYLQIKYCYTSQVMRFEYSDAENKGTSMIKIEQSVLSERFP